MPQFRDITVGNYFRLVDPLTHRPGAVCLKTDDTTFIQTLPQVEGKFGVGQTAEVMRCNSDGNLTVDQRDFKQQVGRIDTAHGPQPSATVIVGDPEDEGVPYHQLNVGTRFHFAGNPLTWVKIDNSKAHLDGDRNRTTIVSTGRRVWVAVPKPQVEPRRYAEVWAVAWEPGPHVSGGSGGHDWYITRELAEERWSEIVNAEAWNSDRVVLVRVEFKPALTHEEVTRDLDADFADLSDLHNVHEVLRDRRPIDLPASDSRSAPDQLKLVAFALLKKGDQFMLPGEGLHEKVDSQHATCLDLESEKHGDKVLIALNQMVEPMPEGPDPAPIATGPYARSIEGGDDVVRSDTGQPSYLGSFSMKITTNDQFIRSQMASLSVDDVVTVLLFGGGGIWNATVGESDSPEVLTLESRESETRVGITKVHADAIVAITKHINLPKEQA